MLQHDSAQLPVAVVKKVVKENDRNDAFLSEAEIFSTSCHRRVQTLPEDFIRIVLG